MGKRLGLARLEAMMENLKRDLMMSGSVVKADNIGSNSGKFGAPPIVIDDDSTVAAGTDEGVMIHQYADGLRLHVQNVGTQTILIPAADTHGMDYSYDATDDEGVQWVASMNTHKGDTDVDRFTVGTRANGASGAFYMEMQISIGDVSDTDDCLFGFRKVEAFQAAVDNYADMAALNVNAGNIIMETIVGGAATTSTDTTNNFGDGETHTLRVDVDSGGKVTYQIDGKGPIVTAAFTFTAGSVVTPFGYHIHAAGSSMGIIYKYCSWGLA